MAIERGKARSIVVPADLGGGHEGKQIATATAKIAEILWGAIDKATGALRAAPFVVCSRSIGQFWKMLTLRGGNQLLLLSLKWRL